MMILYKVGTTNSEHQGMSSYNVLAKNAEEAIEKVKKYLVEFVKDAEKDGENVTGWEDEHVETVEVEGLIDIE